MKPILLSWLVLTGSLLAAPGDPLRTDINPALVYYRAFLMTPEPMSEADRKYLESKKGKEQNLPERFGKILAGYDSQFLLVRQAAQATVPCDWGIDLSPGPNLPLPQLARAKAVAQAAQWRAVWALEHGRPEEARDDLLAAYVLGRNSARGDFLIGVLVQQMIEALDYGTVAQHFGEFPPETLKQLVDGFEAAPARRTMADCMPGEKHAFFDWMVRRLEELQKAHPQDDAKALAGFRECGVVMAMDFVGYTNFWPRLVSASGGTSEGVLRLLRETGSLWPRVTRILALPAPEYETEANQLLAEIRQSQNPFLPALNLYFGGFVLGGHGREIRARAREFAVQAQLAMVRAAVEYKRHGEAGLKSVPDPFGKGPFAYRRFVFRGADRGFELQSAYAGAEAPFRMIFVEKKGPAFQVMGSEAGKAIAP